MSLPKAPLIIKILVPFVGLGIGVIALVLSLGVLKAWWGTPFSIVEVKADQPIQFRHDMHVAQGIDCQYCHRAASEGEAATLPAVQLCYFCHQIVKKDSPEIQKVLAAYQNGEPLNWVRVHRLPDHVQFIHEAHIKFFSENNEVLPSQVCSTCHGDVGQMQIAEQVRNLKMRDCVDCHRGGYTRYLIPDAIVKVQTAIDTGVRRAPPTDCATCHY